MNKVKIFCFSGIDGSGKSTQAFMLYFFLRRRGIKVDYLWLRWFAFLTYFLYIYARVLKRSIIVRHRKGVIKVHAQWMDKTLKKLYPYLLILDIILWYTLNIIVARFRRIRMLILDRSFIDSVLDIVWEIRSTKFLKGWLGKLVYRVLKNQYPVILVANTKIVLQRKQDIISIKEINFKKRGYEVVAKHIHIPMLDSSDSSISETFKELLGVLDEYNVNSLR